LIVTDFDGVILQSESAKDDAFLECFSIYENHIDDFMAYHKSNPAIGRYQKFDHFYTNILNEEFTKNKLNWISKRFNQIAFRNVVSSKFIPGALNFLKKYSELVPIIIVSGTPKEELLKVLKYLEINKFISKVFSVPPHKSYILSRILIEEKIKPDQTIYIGDMESDKEAALKNNIPFLGIINDKYFKNPPSLYIENLDQISSYLHINYTTKTVHFLDEKNRPIR
tara:strand:- start:5648 stop:6322 length:675 start_codon:yes stop_codon:yes gene_type:complete